MPQPKLATFPAIRRALRFYKIASIITGVGLLLLVTEMLLKYTPLHTELFAGGTGGFLWFAPVIVSPECTPISKLIPGLDTCEMVSTGTTGGGVNISLLILIVHGWFYVVYLFACFQIWSRMRWGFGRFLLLALGGVVPFLSFIMEARVVREVTSYLAAREAAELSASAEHPHLNNEIPTENKR